MFSNKLWVIKVGITICLASWLSRHSHYLYTHLCPPFQRCLALPEGYHGVRIITEELRVSALTATGFKIEQDGIHIEVRGANVNPRLGEYVKVIGRFDKAGYILAERVKVYYAFRIKRVIMFIVSLVCFVIYLGFFLRRFGPRSGGDPCLIR
jgi:hypothetical protein